MDPSADPPSEALKQSLAASVEAYRETCFQVTFPELQQAVVSVNETIDRQLASGDLDEEDGSERFGELRFYHFNGELANRDFTEDMDEEIGLFNNLLDPDIARKVLTAVAPPPSNRMKEHMAEVLESLQRRVNAEAAPGEDATLPAGYHVFATLADEILPPGLPHRLNSLGVVHQNYPSIVTVPSNQELDRRLNFTQAGWKVYAGFITQNSTRGDEFCSGWALCETAAGDYVKDTSKKWRIVFSFLGDSFIFHFNGVEAFLRWQAGYGVRELSDWNVDTEQYA